MTNVGQGDDDDDTTTPIDLDARRPETPFGRAWLGLQRTATRTVDRIREARVHWGQADPEHQAALAWEIADVLRELGDWAHGLAGQIEDYARRRGVPRGTSSG